MSFGLLLGSRRTIRQEVNPMDKSTIISIYPKAIDETKPTIQPGRFHIDAGTYEKPALLTVGPSSWWKDVGEEEPLIEVPTSSIAIAKSVITDYANGLLACDMGESMPGLFYVLGEKNLTDIQVQFKSELDRAAARQKNWFLALVRLGDVMWSRSNGNPMSISDDMKLAARQLNLDDKPW